MKVQKKGDSEVRGWRAAVQLMKGRTEKQRGSTQVQFFFSFLFCLFSCRTSTSHTRRHFLPDLAAAIAVHTAEPRYAQHQHTGSSSRCLVVGEADRWRTNEGETASGRVLNFKFNFKLHRKSRRRRREMGGVLFLWHGAGTETPHVYRVPLTRVFTEYM